MMKQKLSHWTLHPLNLPSRLVLIKAVLQAMLTYLFSVLLAPKSILRKIRHIQCIFLWGGREEKAKFALVSWDSICKPKLAGGLGLRDPEIMAKVQGEKVWWRWVSHSTEPWARLWSSKYGHDRPQPQLIRFSEEQQGSPIWNKAKAGRKIIQRHSFWEIRDGRSARFWEDSWNQLPQLSDNPHWTLIQDWSRSEGRFLVQHFWQEQRPNE